MCSDERCRLIISDPFPLARLGRASARVTASATDGTPCPDAPPSWASRAHCSGLSLSRRKADSGAYVGREDGGVGVFQGCPRARRWRVAGKGCVWVISGWVIWWRAFCVTPPPLALGSWAAIIRCSQRTPGSGYSRRCWALVSRPPGVCHNSTFVRRNFISLTVPASASRQLNCLRAPRLCPNIEITALSTPSTNDCGSRRAHLHRAILVAPADA